MVNPMRRILILAILMCLVGPSFALSADHGGVTQTGSVVPRHLTMWATSGSVMDAGPAAGGTQGKNPSEIGVTNTGTPFCVTDAPTTSPYHQLCLGASSNNHGLISYNAYNGASPLSDNLLSFSDTTGLNIKDSGFSSVLLRAFTGDSGSGGVTGIVPAPPSGSAAANWVLTANGNWAPPVAGSLTLTGVVTGSGAGTLNTSLTSNSVTNASLAQSPANTVKCNNTGGTANELDCTQAQATALLNAFTGDAGTGGIKGMVPAPAAGDAAANKVLGAGGGWVVNGIPSLTLNQVYQGNGSNLPVSTTLSTAIDNAIGSTRGSILERGAAGWVLATPGASGTIWTSNGVGADPTYQALATAVTSVTGTAGQVTTSPTTGAVVVSLPATITPAETFSGAVTFNGSLAGTAFAAPPALGGTTPAAGAFTTLSATGNLTTNVTGSTQCLQANASGVVTGAGAGCNTSGITQPPSGSIYISNGTNTPANLAPVVNRLAVGIAGPTWSTLATANNAVLVTSAAGAPSLATTLPSGLSIPGFAPLASPTFTGTPAGPNPTQGTNTTQLATTNFVKLQQLPMPIGWIAGLNPNNAVAFTANQAMTVQAIVGHVEIPNGSAATVTINKVPGSGTACSAGTILHSGSFNANGTAAANQTLTLVGGAADNLAVGDSVCLQTGGGANWTSGNAVGTITVFVTLQ